MPKTPAKKTPTARKTPRAATPRARPAAKKAPAAKPKAAAPAPVASPPPAAASAEPKSAKTKLVRDSFTIPKAEYAVLDRLKQRATGLAHVAKKSELLRAGIKALAAMGDADFLAAVQAVPSIKTGRPKARKSSDSTKAA